MKHQTSRTLHAYWDELRGERAAPERGEIEPGAIRHVLADSLVLEIEAARRSAVIRLAGTRVCALFGRELRGVEFARLWGGDRCADPWRLVQIVIEETAGLVCGVKGRTAEGDVADMELVLLPLRHRGRTQDRIIGALSASTDHSWIGLKPLTALETLSLRVLTGDPTTPPEPANDHCQQALGGPILARHPPDRSGFDTNERPRFVVHQGGRT